MGYSNEAFGYGKTFDEAVDDALQKLNTTIDKVDIETVEEPKKGFLGIGSKPAKVCAKIKFDPEDIAKTFLREVFACMGISVEIQTVYKDKQLNINLKGDEMGVIIGKRGQTLDSLQYLVNLVVNKGDASYISINIDTEDYRSRRKETLERLAFNLANKAKHIRRNVVLEPMNPYERRIIHSALQNDKCVTTFSEGDEPFRYVVISPKR